MGARVCGEGEGVELDVRVRPRGENYSTSRGEHYARMVSLGTKNEPGNAIRETSSYKRFCITLLVECVLSLGKHFLYFVDFPLFQCIILIIIVICWIPSL